MGHTQRMLDPQHSETLRQRIDKIPIVATLQMRDFALDAGTCAVTVPRQRMFDGVFESLHGGILMTIADSIACFAVLTQTPPDQVLTTTDMNIRFLSPCLTDVRATARVIKRGRLMCPVAVELHDTNGTLVAIAQVNYVLLERMPTRVGS
jgi:uncharacterized protein (TIGR00369 family)